MAPMMLGVIPFGMVCGVGAIAAGASPIAALAMSMIMFSGAAQIVATQLLVAGAPFAVILLSQLREIYIDAELEPVDTVQWYPRLLRKDYTVGLNVTETGVDDPDQQFYENYVCGADRNYTGYCSPETDKLVDRQSMEPDPEKRRKLVWEIERRLAEVTLDA